MQDVRDFRAGAPTPDRGRLAPGRDRLVAAAKGRSRARRLRADWRFAAVGAAAALTAVAVLATNIGGDGGDRSAPADTRTVRGSVGEVMDRAATAIEKADPPATPRAGQWIYKKTLSRSPGGWPKSKVRQPEPKEKPQESWTLYADPRFENGKEGDDRSPRERLQFLNTLPDDPDAVLKKIRAYYPSGKDNPESEGEHDMRAMSVVLETRPMPPRALAKLYRALAEVPGAEVTRRLVHDAAGRDAIAVGNDEKGQEIRREILIDPRTYQYLGDRWVVVKDYKESYAWADDDTPDRPWKAGDVMFQNALLDTAVVDRKGDRP